TRMLGGINAARAFISTKENDWNWWNDDHSVRGRPAAALTILKPDSKYEAGKPARGIAVRVRVNWNSNRNTLRESASELVSLEIDGREVEAKLVTVKGRGPNPSDSYYIYETSDLGKGKHVAKASVRDIKSGKVEVV